MLAQCDRVPLRSTSYQPPQCSTGMRTSAKRRAQAARLPPFVTLPVPHVVLVVLAERSRRLIGGDQRQVPGIEAMRVAVVPAGHHPGPEAHGRLGEDASGVNHLVHVAGGIAGGDATEVRVVQRRDGPLRHAVVGLTGHADGAVAPRLRGHPVEGVIAVLSLVRSSGSHCPPERQRPRTSWMTQW